MNTYQKFRGQQKHTGKFSLPRSTRDDPPYTPDFRETKYKYMLGVTIGEYLNNQEFVIGRMEMCDRLINEQLSQLTK